MIIKILSKQVPVLWEAIKFATTQADEVESKDLQPYLNELLHALLNDKAQCFVALNDKRVLAGVLVTRLNVNKITNEKFLLLQSVYAWKVLSDQVWKEAYEMFRAFAIKEGCTYLSYMSGNPSVWERMEKMDFKEKTRTFVLRVV